jgi:hypothetical protein
MALKRFVMIAMYWPLANGLSIDRFGCLTLNTGQDAMGPAQDCTSDITQENEKVNMPRSTTEIEQELECTV